MKINSNDLEKRKEKFQNSIRQSLFEKQKISIEKVCGELISSSISVFELSAPSKIILNTILNSK